MEHDAIRSCVLLLEFTLATYEKLSSVKRQSAGELNRHEQILRRAFLPIAKELREFVPRQRSWAIPVEAPRLSHILRYMELGESAEEALARHTLVVRHKQVAADR